jgi:hypothetical protein
MTIVERSKAIGILTSGPLSRSLLPPLHLTAIEVAIKLSESVLENAWRTQRDKCQGG